MLKLSVIIPTYNEENNLYFIPLISKLKGFPSIEIIISDGGSSDATIEICNKYGLKTVITQTTSRAERLNQGIKLATTPFLLLHHPRSIIDTSGLEFLLQHHDELRWGGFSHSFDKRHPLLQFTSFYSNNIRAKLKGIIYLDHCIFLSSSMANQVFDLPAIDIFEDTVLSSRLRNNFGKPQILAYKVKTSAIRFVRNGYLKQSLLNQYLKIRFYLQGDHKKMNRLYEDNISLNSNYQQK